MMVAAGVGAITIFSGVTIIEDGAIPKLHLRIAPEHT